MNNNILLNNALSQIGVKEYVGNEDNPEVLKYFNEIGFDGSKLKDETAWCSAFVNWVAKVSGCEYSGKLNARSWLEYGEQVVNPQVGDIVILWRESKYTWKGHVGFFIRESNDHIYILGGNQQNEVNILPYKKSRLLQYRRL